MAAATSGTMARTAAVMAAMRAAVMTAAVRAGIMTAAVVMAMAPAMAAVVVMGTGMAAVVVMATDMAAMAILMAAVAVMATAMVTAMAAVGAMATALAAAAMAQQSTKRRRQWQQWLLQMRTHDPMEGGRGVLPPHKHNTVGRYCLYLLRYKLSQR
jgi:hypothetical protein